MNVILTGATGFIGSHLLPALKMEGHSVLCLTRNMSDNKNTSDLILFDISIKGIELITRTIKYNYDNKYYKGTVGCINGDYRTWNKSLKCDLFIHCGSAVGRPGQTHQDIWDTNIKGTIALLKHIDAKQYCLISSIAASGYGLHTSFKYNYDNFYGMTKAIQEYLFRKKDENCLILRLPQVYGEGMDYGFVQLPLLLKKGIRFIIDKGNIYYSMLYISNLIDAIILLLNNGCIGNYFIGDNYIPTLREIFNKFLIYWNHGKVISISKSFFIPIAKCGDHISLIPLSTDRINTLTKDMVCDTTKLQNEGFKSKIPLDEGIKRYAKWIDEGMKKQLTWSDPL